MEIRGKNLTYRSLLGTSVPQLSLILAGTTLVTAGNVFLRWCIGDALERGLLSLWLLALAGILLALTQGVGYGRRMLSVRIQRDICQRLQSKVLHSGLSELEKNDMGAITTLYITDVGQIDGFTERLLNKAFPDAVGWLITVGLLFAFDLYLGIAAVAATVLPICLIHRMSRPIAKGTDEYQDALGEANRTIVSGLHNIETIKASCREERFLQDNREKLDILQKKKRVVAVWEALLGAPMLVGAFLTMALLTGLGGWFALRGRISTGQLLTVVTLIDNIVNFVMSLDGTVSRYRRASVSMRRLGDFLGQEAERQGGRTADRIREIDFCRISFAYPGAGRQIYNGFSESWRPGGIRFVQGGNGEGKSTLVKLLMGVYDLSGGNVLINGVSAIEYRLESLRERIVAVPQENVLFRGTIYDNLVFGSAASPRQAEEMCRKVGIHDEIMGMPDGYGTLLSENGGTLSGGQKQRLCLARALLREGDVYVLDEPTSALDAGHSEILMGILRELALEKIVVVITHERELLDSAEHIMRIGGQEG